MSRRQVDGIGLNRRSCVAVCLQTLGDRTPEELLPYTDQ